MKPRASHSSHQTATSRRAATGRALRAVLLATSALATAVLPTMAVRAADGDATWIGGVRGRPPPTGLDGALPLGSAGPPPPPPISSERHPASTTTPAPT